ncbi:MAG: hypothetical protein WA913_08555 [Pricia sp.]
MSKHHLTCLPYVLGYLNYLNEKYDGAKWGRDLKKLFHDAMELGGSGGANIDFR